MIKCDKSMLQGHYWEELSLCPAFVLWGGGTTREDAYCLDLLFQRFGGLSFVLLREKLFEGHVWIKSCIYYLFFRVIYITIAHRVWEPGSPEGSCFLIRFHPTLWCSICQRGFASAGADKVGTATWLHYYSSLALPLLATLKWLSPLDSSHLLKDSTTAS